MLLPLDSIYHSLSPGKEILDSLFESVGKEVEKGTKRTIFFPPARSLELSYDIGYLGWKVEKARNGQRPETTQGGLEEE
jgi:hypothetical protein